MTRDDMTHMEAVFLPIDRDRPSLRVGDILRVGVGLKKR